MPLPIPEFLDWHILYINVFFCKCFRKRRLSKYKETLGNVRFDLHKNRDIFTLLRRFKMYGLALTTLLDNPARKFISSQ